jgi:hypothetical protein
VALEEAEILYLLEVLEARIPVAVVVLVLIMEVQMLVAQAAAVLSSSDT